MEDAKRVPAYVCPGCKSRIPFGTEAAAAPGRCPGCRRRLWIPNALEPDAVAEVICPGCATRITALNRRPGGGRFACHKYGAAVTLPPRPPE